MRLFTSVRKRLASESAMDHKNAVQTPSQGNAYKTRAGAVALLTSIIACATAQVTKKKDAEANLPGGQCRYVVYLLNDKCLVKGDVFGREAAIDEDSGEPVFKVQEGLIRMELKCDDHGEVCGAKVTCRCDINSRFLSEAEN